jgi:hypothetical protein
MALVLAKDNPSLIMDLNYLLSAAYFTVFILSPLLYKKYIAPFSRFPLKGGSSFRVIKHVKYFL